MYSKIFIIVFIFQLLILLIGIIKKDYKFCISIISCIFPFIILYCFLANIYENLYGNGTLALNETLSFIIKMFSFVILEIILFIIAIIEKRILLNNNLEDHLPNRKIVYISIITTIIITITSFSIIFYNSMNNIKISTINYLNNKYGDNGFKVIKKENDYSDNGFVSRYLVGYNIKIKDSNNNIFNVYVDDKLNEFSDEYLLTLYGNVLNNNSYYKHIDNILENECKKLNNSLFSKKYNMKFYAYNIGSNNFNGILSGAIPNDYNRVPNINETKKLVNDFILTHNMRIELYNKYETDDEYEKYFESVARAINDYYNDISYFESDVEYMDNEGYFVIDNENIYISMHGNLINLNLSECKKITK